MAKRTVQLKRVEVSQVEGLRGEGFLDPIVQFDTQASIQDEEGGDDDDKEPEALDPLAEEVDEIFGGCAQQAVPLLDPSLRKMAKLRPIPGEYEDESPSPKPVDRYVYNVFGVKGGKGGGSGIHLLTSPQRPLKDKVTSKPDLFAEVESWGFARVRIWKQDIEQRILKEQQRAARDEKRRKKRLADPEYDRFCLPSKRIQA